MASSTPTQNTFGSPLPLIETTRLAIRKGSLEVLESVDITIRSGLLAAVVGPSGSGKTCLLRALASLDEPTDGAVKYNLNSDGRSPSSSKTSLYPRITYVPQNLSLWPHMTFRQNLLFAADQSDAVTLHMHALCERLGLESLLDRKPQSASQGQRQRFALVRALILKPIVLLCDEVTSALDEDLASTVWTIFRDFVDNGGAVFASTHDVRLMSQCDEVYRISQQTIKRGAGEK